MLAALLLSKELGIVRKHNGNGTSDPASGKSQKAAGLNCLQGGNKAGLEIKGKGLHLNLPDA